MDDRLPGADERRAGHGPDERRVPTADDWRSPQGSDDRRPTTEQLRAKRSGPPGRPLQPVVIGFGRFGDMVMLSSVLHLLHHRFRRPCLVLGAGSWTSWVYRGHPDVARVRTFTRHFPFVISLTWWRVLWELRRTDPSPIYICERQSRQLERIRRMLAFSGINSDRCVFLAEGASEEGDHWVDRFIRTAQQTPAALDAADYPVPVTGCQAAPRLRVLDSERVELDDWLKRRGWAGRDLILVQPGNFRSMSKSRERWRQQNADDKAWPLERWVLLLHKVHAAAPNALIILRGAPQEGPMLREIEVATALSQVVATEVSSRQLLALCEAAHSMISVDTGPAHAAAALGLPVVVMFGAASQRLWLPRSPCGSPILGVGGPPASTRVDQIPVDDVFNAWRTLLALRERPRQPDINLTPSCELT